MAGTALVGLSAANRAAAVVRRLDLQPEPTSSQRDECEGPPLLMEIMCTQAWLLNLAPGAVLEHAPQAREAAPALLSNLTSLVRLGCAH